MSSSGQYQSFMGTNGCGIYYSSNYGQTWTISNLSSIPAGKTICCSSSGQYQLAGNAVGYGPIYYSTNYGQTWTTPQQASSYSINSINGTSGLCMSSNGQYALNYGTSTGIYQSILRQPIANSWIQYNQSIGYGGLITIPGGAYIFTGTVNSTDTSYFYVNLPIGITVVSAFASIMNTPSNPIIVYLHYPTSFPYLVPQYGQVAFAINNTTIGNLTTMITYTIYAHS